MKTASSSKQTTPRIRGVSQRRADRRLAWASDVVLAVATSGLRASPADAIENLRAGGHALVIRHALAPGFGDSENFRLGDCTTQWNLSDAGRAQARAIGDWLRARGIDRARVYSRPWCRCLETANLLGLGPVTELPALNSFFERTQDRAPNTSHEIDPWRTRRIPLVDRGERELRIGHLDLLPLPRR